MAEIKKDDDQLGTSEKLGFSTAWLWKEEYMSNLNDDSGKDGYERFSQYSATPDTTALFAGPARFTAMNTNGDSLLPIGLVDGIQFNSQPMLQRLYEIGSNRAFFTRGKTISSLSFSKMFADQHNVLAALRKNAYAPPMSDKGSASAGADSPNPDIMMNLDSEYFSVPFGLMLVFKTRGGGYEGTGRILSAVYLEYCMFSSYNFSIQSQSPVIMENVGIEFDRAVPLSFGN